MWNFISNCLLKNNDIVLFDDTKSFTNKALVALIEDKCEKLVLMLQPKMKCAILCKNEMHAAIALLLCWRLNMVAIPLSTNYGQEHYLTRIEFIKPNIIFTDMKINELKIQDVSCYNVNTDNFYERNVKTSTEECLTDVAVIMCTSGTTGTPKGVMLSSEALIRNVINIASYFHVCPGQRILISRPLYHCAVLTGEYLFALYTGLQICFMSTKYNPILVLKYMTCKDINVMCGTPTLFRQLSLYMYEHQIEAHINTMAISGECLTKEIAKVIRRSFPETNVYCVYGLTEAAPRVSWLPPEKFDLCPESVGIPLPETQIKISKFGDSGLGVEGEIFVKSPSIMKGYYKAPFLTKRVIKDSWLATGDIGYFDDNGLLYVCSRVDDLIIKAGMNIYPKEIEDAIRRIEIIQDVVAFGVKTNEGEQIVVKVVTSRKIEKRELLHLFSQVLPGYLMPSEIEIVTNIGKTISGKIIRSK